MNTPDKDGLQPEDSNDSVPLRVIVPVCVGGVLVLVAVVAVVVIGVAVYKRYYKMIPLSDTKSIVTFAGILPEEKGPQLELFIVCDGKCLCIMPTCTTMC